MKTERNWGKAKWIFEPDGALRDIYVQDVNESDWEKLISFLNSKYELEFGTNKENGSGKIDFSYIKKMWSDENGELEIKSLTINLNGIIVKSYFFCPEQIEFDIKPNEIKSSLDLDYILGFMSSVSEKLKKQVTLSEENQAEFPLIKIDFEKGFEKILTKKEMISISKKAGIYVSSLIRMKERIWPKRLPVDWEYKAMESACKPYKPVSKDQNLW